MSSVPLFLKYCLRSSTFVDFPEPIFPSTLTMIGCGYGCGAYGMDVSVRDEVEAEVEAEAEDIILCSLLYDYIINIWFNFM
jgi:hypothetical protein